MKTITIHQGQRDEKLEMSVQVTQEEFDKMEEIRNINPSVWEDRELDLVKAAKEAVAKSNNEGINTPDGKTNWKVLIWVILGIVVIFVVIVFIISKSGKKDEIKDPSYGISETINQSSTENLRKVYDKLVKLGSKGSYSQFVDYFEESESNRKNVYDKCKQNGYKGSYEQFLEYVGYIDLIKSTQNVRDLYDLLNENGAVKGSYEQFIQWLYVLENRRNLYYKMVEAGVVESGTIYDFYAWLGLDFNHKINPNNLEPNLVEFNKIGYFYKTYNNSIYKFSYQYDEKEYELVNKTNNSSHCVMKLQSPTDAMRSILVSVWENVNVSSSYESNFIDRVQQSDKDSGGEIICSASKTKVCGVNALKSELKIIFMGHKYYAAIYRIIHKQRMYMINIYIPINEYNRNNSYADECIERFKFD